MHSNTEKQGTVLADSMPQLSHPGSHVLDQRVCGDGVVRVCENEHYRWLDFGNAYTQALMLRAAPHRLVLQYTQAMTLAYAFNPRAQRLLNLGVGSGSFERFFMAHFAAIELTSVEAEASIVSIAREYFALAPEHQVQLTTAERFVSIDNSSYDLIFCDLHDGDTHPVSLTRPDFYHQLRSRMSANGVLVLNLLPSSEDDLVDVLKALRTVFKWQCLLDFEHIGNLLLFALIEKPAAPAQIEAEAAKLTSQTGIDFPFINRLIPLPEVV